ncbi:hypothetical protein GCK32_011940, partial [Trichostrongylus colubriformis]
MLQHHCMISPDQRYVALLVKTSNRIDHKFNMTYSIHILNRETRAISKVGVARNDNETQRIFRWCPTGHDYIFWQDGHWYYSDSPESASSVRISNGPSNWEHGIYDWIDEEGTFGPDIKAVWWSESGKKLAYLSREKPKGKSVFMISYNRHEKYPTILGIPYAKTHEKLLPTYVINIWDKKAKNSKQMDVQLRDRTAYPYLYGVKWVEMKNEEVLVATWANRLQNRISVTICDYKTAICNLVFEYRYPEKMWAETPDFSSVLSNRKDAVFILLPRARADGNSYQHIAKLLIQYDSQGKLKLAEPSFLSLGNFDVVALNRYDGTTDTIYFTAQAPSPGNRHLYSTKATPTADEVWACVSCHHKNCTYQSNSISPDFKYLLTHCRGPAHHHYYLSDFKNGKIEKMVRILRDKDYEAALAATLLPTKFTETVTLKDDF